MPQVRIVTDSASDIPADLVTQLDIVVVPLSISFGDRVYLDGEDLTAEEFYRLLATNPNFPRTSQPSVGRFEQVYTRLRDEGAEVVSIHLAAGLSGTLNAAKLAASHVEGAQVQFVDSLGASMIEGALVIAGARWAAEGLAAPEIARRVEAMRPAVYGLIMLDNLAHLQRGGRIGRAESLLGTLLSVKPIVEVAKGEVNPVQRVRTAAKALQELTKDARRRQPLAEARILHSNAPRLVEQLLPMLQPLIPDGTVPVQLLGPVVGVHVGAGAIGVLTVRRQQS
jgi:DegV family protein with EDD domain